MVIHVARNTPLPPPTNNAPLQNLIAVSQVLSTLLTGVVQKLVNRSVKYALKHVKWTLGHSVASFTEVPTAAAVDEEFCSVTLRISLRQKARSSHNTGQTQDTVPRTDLLSELFAEFSNVACTCYMYTCTCIQLLKLQHLKYFNVRHSEELNYTSTFHS